MKTPKFKINVHPTGAYYGDLEDDLCDQKIRTVALILKNGGEEEAKKYANLIEAISEMLNALYDTASVLDLAILQTPTGLDRNCFTELNIKVLSAINKAEGR